MSAQPGVRPPAVPGFFHPRDPDELAESINASFADAAQPAHGAPAPKALVMPHPGELYSGPVAGSGYLRLDDAPHART
jgi:AmmeMemoRadiSam system protein B